MNRSDACCYSVQDMGPDHGQFAIRPHVPADLVRLHEIDRICFPPRIAYSRSELRFFLAGKRAVSRVAETSREVVGFAVAWVDPGVSAHVITLDVVPEARRQGIGRSLMDALHAEFGRRRAICVMLEVSVENVGAQRFYETLGYRTVRLLRGYYCGGVDAYRMVRFLAPVVDQTGR